MKQTTLIIVGIVALIVGAAAGFFGGMKYQQTKMPLQGQFFNRVGGPNGGNMPFGNRPGRNGGMGAVTGEILSADDKSITVKLADGSSKIVLLSDKLTINKAAEATKSDLTVGTRVAVFGSPNSDGSVTAQNIQINPMFRMGGGNRQPNQAQKSPDAKEIVVEGSNYKFSPDTITVKVGQKTRILFKNAGGMHDFRVDELNLATAVIPDGQTDFVEFTPDKAGTYKFYCSVANHRAMGMEGTLIIQ